MHHRMWRVVNENLENVIIDNDADYDEIVNDALF